jgi:hypothetical protein
MTAYRQMEYKVLEHIVDRLHLTTWRPESPNYAPTTFKVARWSLTLLASSSFLPRPLPHTIGTINPNLRPPTSNLHLASCPSSVYSQCGFMKPQLKRSPSLRTLKTCAETLGLMEEALTPCLEIVEAWYASAKGLRVHRWGSVTSPPARNLDLCIHFANCEMV